jgi:hypothetical protein
MKKLASLFLALSLCLGLTVPALAASTYSTYSYTNDEGRQVATFQAAYATATQLKFLDDEGTASLEDVLLITVKPGSSVSVRSDAGEVTYILGSGYQLDKETNAYFLQGFDTGPWTCTVEEMFDGFNYTYDLVSGGYSNGKPVYIALGSKADASTSPAATAPSFTDVAATSPFYAAIQWAVDRGITKGTSSTTFSPSNLCTNNHILTFLWRANGSPAATVANPFDNIDTSGDFGKAALWAYEQGLISGTSFPGTVNCTRAQTMLYFWKQAGSPATPVSDKFTDVPADAEYAQAVAWAVAQGITNGTSGTTFSPDATCTRGQIVTFLYRALNA